jgi:hypothetical protein
VCEIFKGCDEKMRGLIVLAVVGCGTAFPKRLVYQEISSSAMGHASEYVVWAREPIVYQGGHDWPFWTPVILELLRRQLP